MNKVPVLMMGRGGSRGVPGKNTMPILGRPLMEYPILAAKNSSHIGDIYISTDAESIKEIGRKNGLIVIDRPAELCTDTALAEDVILHGYKQMEIISGKNIDMFVLLFCNTATITPGLIDKGIEMLNEDTTLDSAVSVSMYNEYSPVRAKRITPEGLIMPYMDVPIENASCDRDTAEPCYFCDCSVWVLRATCMDIDNGVLPFRWMGHKSAALYQQGGLDIDHDYGIAMTEHWLRKHGFSGDSLPYQCGGDTEKEIELKVIDTLIIYGASERGRKLKANLSNMLWKAKELFFCDGNEELQGTVVDGVSVISPGELKELGRPEAVIAIASTHYFEIYMDIVDYGFKNYYYLSQDDEIMPFDEQAVILKELNRVREKNKHSMLYYTCFESYKHISADKYKQGKLFNEPLFGFERHLHEFVDKHKGKRCFIMGNGPSLNDTDVSILKNEITFGANLIYKAFPIWKFHTTYWCVEDELIFLQYYNDIVKSIPKEALKFVPLSLLFYTKDKPTLENVVPYNILFGSAKHYYSFDPSGIYHGNTVTYSMIQLAVIMGCNPIYLIGVDHYYPSQFKSRVADKYYCDTEKEDHFMPLNRNGAITYIHRYHRTTISLELAYKELSKRGIEIYNASPGTKLEVIPKINYDDIFK